MNNVTLANLQKRVRDGSAFNTLDEYLTICLDFLSFINDAQPTRIISPSHPHYIFYQYDAYHGFKITRPLNTRLFIESADNFKDIFERFIVKDIWTFSK